MVWHIMSKVDGNSSMIACQQYLLDVRTTQGCLKQVGLICTSYNSFADIWHAGRSGRSTSEAYLMQGYE